MTEHCSVNSNSQETVGLDSKEVYRFREKNREPRCFAKDKDSEIEATNSKPPGEEELCASKLPWVHPNNTTVERKEKKRKEKKRKGRVTFTKSKPEVWKGISHTERRENQKDLCDIK